MEKDTALDDIIELLETAGIEYYLFGAQAAILYGTPRATADIDLTISVNDRRLQGLIDVLGDQGFSLRADDPFAFAERTRVLPVLHEASRVPIDLVLAGPGLEHQFMKNRRTATIGDRSVKVIAPEDLIVTKLLAGRPKDLADALAVVRRQDKSLDVERVEGFLRQIEQALDRSDLLSEFRRMAEQ